MKDGAVLFRDWLQAIVLLVKKSEIGVAFAGSHAESSQVYPRFSSWERSLGRSALPLEHHCSRDSALCC